MADEKRFESLIAAWKYEEEHPAFVGSYEFDIVFELLDERIARRARVNYKHTPDWEYFDCTRVSCARA
jgi:hypothetical protein